MVFKLSQTMILMTHIQEKKKTVAAICLSLNFLPQILTERSLSKYSTLRSYLKAPHTILCYHR